MFKTNIKNRGFSFVEIMIVIGIIVLVAGIILSGFVSFRKSQTLVLDTQAIISALNQARNQTLLSKDSSVYGVHFTSNTATIFTGSTYSSNSPSNENINLYTPDISITSTLSGGGSDVVFNRLTGETSKNGTITINSPSFNQTKTVTIYKTGLIDSQ